MQNTDPYSSQHHPAQQDPGSDVPPPPVALPEPPHPTSTGTDTADTTVGSRVPGTTGTTWPPDELLVTLDDVGPGRPYRHTPVVTVEDRDILVVLDWSRSDVDLVEVWSRRHQDALRPVGTPATAVTDPTQAVTVLTEAVAHLVDQVRALRVDRDCQLGRHQRVLAEIRDHAIDRHLDGVFCRDGLNEFLTRFDLPCYQPRIRITYTITGSYDIDTDDTDPDYARMDAEERLGPDLSSVGPVLDGSDSYDVHVDDATVIREP